MASNLISMAGWYFLPNIACGYIQSTLYAVFIRAGDPKPTPGTPRYARDRKRIFVFVILAYLLYTIYEADYQIRQASDFYQDLGVPLDVDEKGIQSRFRRLTVLYHPDKATGPDKARIEALYVHLKLARDTLVDPAKRFAYDRFGPESLQWAGCKTIHDFVFTGFRNIVLYYTASGAVLVLLGILGYLNHGTFWRHLFVAALFVVEMHAMTRPTFPYVLSGLINPFLSTVHVHPALLPFQLLTLLRKFALTLSIAITQLAPMLQGSRAAEAGDGISPQKLDELSALSKALDVETSRLMGLELAPFAGEQSTLRDLKTGVKDWLVQNTLRNDAEVKTAVEAVLRRRRERAGID